MRGYLVALAAAALACQPRAESPEQAAATEQAHADSARAAVDAGNARFVQFVNANQPDSLLQLFAPNAALLPPDVPIATERDSILARFKAVMAPGGVLTLNVQSLSVQGPMALSRGSWTYAVPAQGITPALNLSGKYMEHWHHMDGRWLIVEDIWNNDAPAPPAPPPPARRN